MPSIWRAPLARVRAAAVESRTGAGDAGPGSRGDRDASRGTNDAMSAPLVALAGRVTRSGRFETLIIVVILINAATLGVDAQYTVEGEHARWLTIVYDVTLAVFVVEAALKMLALAPRSQRYFRDAWNIFDFTIIVLSLVPAVGQLAIVARTARVLRVLRLVSLVPGLRVIVATLVRSIPGC